MCLDYMNIFLNLIFTNDEGVCRKCVVNILILQYSCIFKDLRILLVGRVYGAAIPAVHLCSHFFINPWKLFRKVLTTTCQ